MIYKFLKKKIVTRFFNFFVLLLIFFLLISPLNQFFFHPCSFQIFFSYHYVKLIFLFGFAFQSTIKFIFYFYFDSYFLFWILLYS